MSVNACDVINCSAYSKTKKKYKKRTQKGKQLNLKMFHNKPTLDTNLVKLTYAVYCIHTHRHTHTHWYSYFIG